MGRPQEALEKARPPRDTPLTPWPQETLESLDSGNHTLTSVMRNVTWAGGGPWGTWRIHEHTVFAAKGPHKTVRPAGSGWVQPPLPLPFEHGLHHRWLAAAGVRDPLLLAVAGMAVVGADDDGRAPSLASGMAGA